VLTAAEGGVFVLVALAVLLMVVKKCRADAAYEGSD
jgi:drug/metabolite transporter superfamily protein YnfA